MPNQLIPERLNSDFNFLIELLGLYGRTVERIHLGHKGYVFYVNPPYNGNNTITFEEMYSSSKELDNAVKKIKSIPEFEAIDNANLEVKARILSKFHQAYTGPQKPKLGMLRKFYHGRPIKTPADFYEFYEALMGLATSTFCSPEQLKQIINNYVSKEPSERIILPHADKYGMVNLDDVKIVEQATLPKEPIQISSPVAREKLARTHIRLDTAIEEANVTAQAEKLASEIIESERSTLSVVEGLEKELIKSEDEIVPEE